MKKESKKSQKTQKKDWKKVLVDLEKKIEDYSNKKAPKLPKGIVNFIVKYGPYLMVIGLVFSIPFILTAIGLNALIPAAFMGGLRVAYRFSVWNLVTLATIVLQIIALPGLFKRKLSAWRLLFYISLIDAVLYLITFQLGNLILGTIISWYLLFQIKKEYK